MTKAEVLALLEENQDERGVKHWFKLGDQRYGMRSFGIGLTRLRKMGKKIGRDHKLAQQLWKTDVYDARVMGLLIDDPKQLTREQAEQQVEQLQGGMFSHVFASCDATLAKTPYAFDLAGEWMASSHETRRCCGYTLLYELSKKNPRGMDDAFLLERIEHIRTEIPREVRRVRSAMRLALMGIGKRNRTLNAAGVEVAKEINSMEWADQEEAACGPLDVHKHLTSDYIRKKLGT
jgi:3-methyladenine DNA glycosylase AlkD